MKIAVVAANGRVARKVIAEAVSRGHEVVAFGRHDENDTQAKIYHKKDILELTKEDLAGFDVVVDGFGARTAEQQPMHVKTSQYLCDGYASPRCRRRRQPLRKPGAHRGIKR